MALYNHGVRQGVGTSMGASCAAGWGAYLYPFYSQMAKVELEEVFSEVPLAITESLGQIA